MFVCVWIMPVLVISSHGYSSVKLTGAGASFPYSVYQGWNSVYHLTRLRYANIELKYFDIGSAQGLLRLQHPIYDVDYAGTDTDLTKEQYSKYPDFQLIPTMAGGVVVGFNVPGVQELKLTRDNIVGIYNGSITLWNHPLLQKQNPGVRLPSERIRPVARHERSGTTFLFTSALAAFSEDFKTNYGVFSTPDGFKEKVINMRGRTNIGIIGILRSFNYTIAYLCVAGAKRNSIPEAKIQNKKGRFLAASNTSIQTAMDYNARSLSSRLTRSIMDSDHKDAYPITGYTYLIIRMSGMANCEKAVALYRYIEWFLTSKEAKTICMEDSMVPLSDSVVARVMKKLSQMTCEGVSVAYLAARQGRAELESSTLQLLTPLAITAFLLVSIIILVVLSYRYYKRGQILRDSSWKIEMDDIVDFDTLPPKERSAVNEVAVKVSDMDCSWGKIDGGWIVARSLRDVQSTASHLSRKGVIRCLYMMKHVITHENLTRFYGLAEAGTDILIISESSFRGSLEEIIYGEIVPDDLKFSLAADIVNGIAFLHQKGLIHGSLTSRGCIIDKRWTCKVGDWDYNNVHQSLRYEFTHELHPETIKCPGLQPSSPSDCYSLAVVIYEIFTRKNLLDVKPIQYIYIHMMNVANNLFPPDVQSLVPEKMRSILQLALSLEPKDRPTVEKLRPVLKLANPSSKEVLDCILEKLELSLSKYEQLLQRMLPRAVADKLARNEAVEPEWFEQVTIYFSDIVGFTSLAAVISPIEVVHILNELYTIFDNIVDTYDCYKVETIGDAYMIVSGLPKRNGTRHAVIMAELSIDMAKASSNFRHKQDQMLSIRIGLHTGSVVAGVVGIKMPRYCLFGDTVNTANRMESTSAPMKIQLSETTQALLVQHGNFILLERGIIDIKDKPITITESLGNHKRTKIYLKLSFTAGGRYRPQQFFELHVYNTSVIEPSGLKPKS